MITGLHSLSCITVQSGKTAQDLAQQEDMLTLLKEKSSAEPSKLVRVLINAHAASGGATGLFFARRIRS